ncbi:MAG: hypothetical protein IJR68_07885, partial [Fretibacterium sp.]|nr:hypothetical protein [Fretibacterium sp.]
MDGATNGVAYARDNAIVVSDVYSRQTSKPNDARIKEIEATPEFKAYNEAWLAAEEAGDEETLNRIDEEWEKSELGAEYNNLLNTNRVQVSAVGRPNANMKSTLIHEIQHLVQDIEGFAKGGNPSMFNRSTDQTTMEKWAGLIENLVGAKDENGEVYTIESAAREYLRLAQEELDGLPLEEKIRHKGDFEVEDLAALSKIVNSGNIEETVKRLHEESTKPHLSAEETYRRLAGETEARNASARMEMSPEERRQKLLSETEDVAREDQIVLRDALGGESYDRAQAAELKTESGKSIEEAANSELLTAPDGSTALGYIDADTAAAIGSFEGEIQANVGALRHTEKQGHGKEIRNAGYNVQSFMIDVLNNWTEIREGNDNSLWLVRPLEDRHGGVAAIKLDNKKDGVY